MARHVQVSGPASNSLYGAPDTAKASGVISVPARLPSASFTPVTQPFLPPLAEFLPYLEQIWRNKWLTNDGPFHQQLESELCAYLGVKYISLFANGTLALITALRSLGVTGEVITTPYSFVATAHALTWNGNRPVFVDIDPVTLNLNPDLIEAAITPRTEAILPVHCYGRPCEVERIEEIASRHGLRVIYDGAHAFAVRKGASSLLRAGDLAMTSFHATKVFSTFEGGAIVCHDAETKWKIDRLKNFGIVDEVTVAAPGINAKMSEVAAAFGLLQLKYVDHLVELRKAIDLRYRIGLAGIAGLRCLEETNPEGCNHAYFPILVDPDYPISRDQLYCRFRESSIHARRYFYPLITEFPMYRGMASAHRDRLPVAHRSAERVLCLPMYPGLDLVDQEKVIAILREPGVG